MVAGTKVVISTSTFAEHDQVFVERMQKIGISVFFNPYRRKVETTELIQLASDAVGLIAGTESLSEDVLKQLPKLKVISRCGAGMDNVDLKAAEKLGIKVFNTPDAPTLAVAELTIGVILNMLRKVSLMDRTIRKGQWVKEMGNLLYHKRVGIIGMGRIGRKVANLIKAFDCEVAYYDEFINDNDSVSISFVKMTKEQLLCWADIISIHISGSSVIINSTDFECMKKDAFLVNLARGGVVDENALYNALSTGKLSGAALDVFKDEPYKGALTELPNIVLTAHVGSYAKEARILMEEQAVKNLLQGLGA